MIAIFSFEATFCSTFSMVDAEVDRLFEMIEKKGFVLEYTAKFVLQFALRELFNNSVEHGNKMDSSKHISYKLKMSKSLFDIEIRDEGEGFDPNDVIQKERHDALTRTRNRGLVALADLGFIISGGSGLVDAKLSFDRNIEIERLVGNLKFRIENKQVIFELKSNPVAANIKEMVEVVKSSLESAEEYNSVVIDLSASESIDSMGITFLIGIYKTIKAQDKPVKLSGVSEPMMNLFKIMKLDEVFSIEK